MDMMALRRAAMIGGIAHFVEDTATGNPCVFTTDLAKPLRRLSLSLLHRQSGSGDPSPSNIRPLLPWGAVGTWTGGKNLLNPTGTSEYFTVSDGVYTVSVVPSTAKSFVLGTMNLKKGKTYILSGGYSNKLYMSFSYNATIYSTKGNDSQPFTATGDDTISIAGVINETAQVGQKLFPMIRFASADDAFTSYTPITPHPVNLEGITPPVYGATVDLTTGEVWGTWAVETMSDKTVTKNVNDYQTFIFTPSQVMAQGESDVIVVSELVNGLSQKNISSSKDNFVWGSSANGQVRIKATGYESMTGAEFKEQFADAKFAYKLATPVLLATLTAQQVNALVGVNTVWSDADGVEVTYLKKG